MKFFDFGAFRKIMKMLSHEKTLFHMLVGASHGTSRIFRRNFKKFQIFSFSVKNPENHNKVEFWY